MVYALSTLIAAAAAAGWAFWLRDLEPYQDSWLHWAWFIPVFFLVEVLVVHLDVHREAQSISLSEIPLVVGLVYLGPTHLVVAQILGASLALLTLRRQTLMKAFFNLAQFALVTVVIIHVFRALVGSGLENHWSWLAAVAATIAGDVVAAALVTTAIGLLEGWRIPNLSEFFMLGLGVTVANTGLGLLGVELIEKDPRDAALLIVPLLVTYLAYRGFWRERHRSQYLTFLYDSMRALSVVRDVDDAVREVLREARILFNAEVAGVVLLAESPDQPSRRSILGPGDQLEEFEPVPFGAETVTMDEPLLLTAMANRARHDLPLLGCGVRDALVITLRGEDGPIGALAVANRTGEVNSFTRADLHFLQTFAAHAGVALENRLLQDSLGEVTQARDELAHRVLHDPLTRLANRTLFGDRLEHALSQRGGDESLVGVLFIDLDDFKAVNDVHGHDVGDTVLIAVAERLRACLRPGDTAARLGGDEFTVLLEDVSDPDEVAAVSERILEAFRVPIAVAAAEIPVTASIGQTVAQVGSGAAAEILRRADAAMYVAKTGGKGRWAAAVDAPIAG